MSNIIPVILSGGSGTRLWPLSRKQYPKQYLPLVGDNTMLQETILRLNGLDNLADPIIICNADHRFLVAEQCQQINITNPTILLEPIGTTHGLESKTSEPLEIIEVQSGTYLGEDDITRFEGIYGRA